VAWSLFFEIWVNLLFVVFWPKLTMRVLTVTIALSGSLFLAIILYKHQASVGNIWHSIYGGMPRTIFSFAVGVLISRLRSSGRLRLDVSEGAFIGSMGVLVWYLIHPVSDSARGVYDALFVFLLSPAFVILGTSRHLDKRLVTAFTFLGSVSYALYAIHLPIAAVVQNIAVRHIQAPPIWSIAILGVSTLIVVSYLLDVIYDVPVRRYLSRIAAASA
jgi:peptidoglycan/LPS O-acetylase OafA/YrhL